MTDAVLTAFFSELEKIAATVLMKPLSPAAKGFMNRLTGVTHGASVPQMASGRQLRHALSGPKAPELMTEMHHMGGLLSKSEQSAKQHARQHYEGVLQQQGRVYKGGPGMEQQIGQIGGHSRDITRTGTGVVPQQGTVAAGPRAIKAATQAPAGPGRMPTVIAPVSPYGQTFAAPMGAV